MLRDADLTRSSCPLACRCAAPYCRLTFWRTLSFCIDVRRVNRRKMSGQVPDRNGQGGLESISSGRVKTRNDPILTSLGRGTGCRLQPSTSPSELRKSQRVLLAVASVTPCFHTREQRIRHVLWRLVHAQCTPVPTQRLREVVVPQELKQQMRAVCFMLPSC